MFSFGRGPYISHYYGDLVRRLFLVAGVILILSLPFFKNFVPFPIAASAVGVLTIGFLAGMTSPRHDLVVALDVLISIAGLVLFEYYAVQAYPVAASSQDAALFFWTNELLAVLFFFALYFSAKTLRGHVLTK